MRNILSRIFLAVCRCLVLSGCKSGENATRNSAVSDAYEDLVILFREFREFQKPPMINGVPDYSSSAMEEQWQGLKGFQERLAACDTSQWAIAQQVDYHLVRAEMTGMKCRHLSASWAGTWAWWWAKCSS